MGEFTHVLSLLSDTANILGERKRKLSQTTSTSMLDEIIIPIIVTINNSTFERVTKRVYGHLHHWVDFVASLSTLDGALTEEYDEDDKKTQRMKLSFKNIGLLAPKAQTDCVDDKKECSFEVVAVNLVSGLDIIERSA